MLRAFKLQEKKASDDFAAQSNLAAQTISSDTQEKAGTA